MLRRLFLFSVFAAALLLSTGADCGRKPHPPDFILFCDTAYADVHMTYALVAADQSFDSTRYIVDWGNGLDTTEQSFLPGDTARVWHMWSDTGRYQVRARMLATIGARPRLSDWCETETVQVVPYTPDSPPVLDSVGFHPRPQVNQPCTLVVFAHDPAGDSLRVKVGWGTGDTTTGFLASPCTARFAYVFTQPETVGVLVELIDWKGVMSSPETIYVPIVNTGGVIWWSFGQAMASPVVASDGVEDCIYIGIVDPGESYGFYAISALNWRIRHTAQNPAASTGHPAYCAATQHIIVSGDEGAFYALNLDLSTAWEWPTGPWWDWGAPAISGDKIYVGNEGDSMCYLIDSVTKGVRVAAYYVGAGIVDAPVIDAQGNVYFGTDSGYLYKLNPNLDTVLWRKRLLANGEIHCPIVGSDGTVYCESESSRLYAIDPVSGELRWTVPVEGDAFRPALGQSALFVGNSLGKVYSIDPATGAVNWQKQVSALSDGFSTTPIVAANGYVYFQNDADVLFCLTQADGIVVWYCDCPRYLPRSSRHGSKRLQLTDYPPNPTITASGNIIVAGGEAVYCVAGYPECPLDPLAPWPKWQHDVYNTGCMGGGR